VNLLVDSHTLIWSYFDVTRLSATAQSELANLSNRIFVSAASHWELAIKLSIGKLSIAEPFPAFIQHAVVDTGFEFLPIEPHHTAILVGLPHHHRDPFDRLIIAQALAENMPIVGSDPVFDQYPIRRIW
jgi:PIN domain nuclease of toxin-antitoxin system